MKKLIVFCLLTVFLASLVNSSFACYHPPVTPPSSIPTIPSYYCFNTTYPGTQTNSYEDLWFVDQTNQYGPFAGWCANMQETVNSNQFMAQIIPSYPNFDAALFNGIITRPQNLPKVNWIINQLNVLYTTGYTVADIQLLMWWLLFDPQGYYSAHDVFSWFGITAFDKFDQLLADADANASFVPTPGQLMLYVVNPVALTCDMSAIGQTETVSQPYIIVLPVPTVNSVYVTYTQGGWGACPKGKNPATILANNFVKVFGANGVRIGSDTGKKLTFTSAKAIQNFLPAKGTAKSLTASAINPTTSTAGVLAGQVLSLELSVDFAEAGIFNPYLGWLKVAPGLKFAGLTVYQVLYIANEVLGGNLSVLPKGYKIADVNSIVDAINNNFDGGSTNLGVLVAN